MQNAGKEIFFHVGLGKTASTYLQYKVFPKFKGVYYIQRTRYRKSHAIINKTNYDKYLVSREFDRQLEREVSRFAASFPDAKPIIILRQQDSWIASQYRRFVKNGRPFSFTAFIDIEQDTGVWKKEELFFMKKIRVLEKYFKEKPLVLFHDDLKKDPWLFIDGIADYIGATYDKKDISLNPSHKSYNIKQLIILRKLSRMIGLKRIKVTNNRFLKWLAYRYRWLLCHLVLYVAYLIPYKVKDDDVLIPPEELEKIRNYYADDWQACLDYAGKIDE